MKRSEINRVIKQAIDRLEEYRIRLPHFGYWSLEEWKVNDEKLTRVKERMLGWDVTDFGSGDFKRCGAVLFTVRNGDVNDTTNAAPYAEKYIIMSDENNQELPLHYHVMKTEDIINRGGGVLCVQLYAKAGDGGIDESGREFDIYTDAVKHTIKSGDTVMVYPGDSITIEPYVYHRFYAKQGEGKLIIGEVSKVNNDNTDNIFYKKSERFCPVEEDEEPVCPLVNEY